MPLGLHTDCKARLLDTLSSAIGSIIVKNGMFLDRLPSWMALFDAEKVLPIKGKIRDQLVNCIDERPLTEFVMSALSYELKDAKYRTDLPSSKLTELEGYKDARAVATRLVDQFENLPQQYILSIRLPSALDNLVGPDTDIVELSPSIKIVRATPTFQEAFPLTTKSESLRTALYSGPGLLSALMNPDAHGQWKNQALYLQLKTSGYIGIYGGTNTYADALRILRSFFGLGLAIQLFDASVEYGLAEPKGSVIVHKQLPDGSFEVYCKVDLSDTLAGALGALKLNAVNGLIDSQEKQDQWSERNFEEMRAVFRNEKKAEPILLGSQWYFDGVYGADELHRYVQSMIVLEIILGDKATSDILGLNELLRNRCAYLLGKSQEERAEIHETFGRIYDIRSQIVHRGKHRLTADERWLMHRLRWLCRRVIQKEVDLLRANKKDEPPPDGRAGSPQA